MNTTKRKPGLLRSNWDERQRQDYQRIHSSAYQILWGLLLLSILAQVLLYPGEPVRWLPEIGLFLLINLYAGARAFRAGLWSMTGPPSRRQSLLGSLAAALIITLVSLLRMALSGFTGSLVIGGLRLSAPLYLLLQALLVFLLALGLISILAARHRRRQQQLEQALDDEEQRGP